MGRALRRQQLSYSPTKQTKSLEQDTAHNVTLYWQYASSTACKYCDLSFLATCQPASAEKLTVGRTWHANAAYWAIVRALIAIRGEEHISIVT